MLRYDRVLHAYIDSESGAIIPLEEGELPPNEAQESDQMRADREYAESLVRRDRERLMQYGRENTSNVANPKNASPLSRLPYYGPIIATPSEEQLSRRSPTSSTPPFSDQRSMPGVPQPSSYDTISLEQDYINLHINDSESMPNSNGQQHASWDDWTLARTLQMMEFEIAEEVTDRPTNGDFAEKEVRASSFCRQIKTISFIICLVQIAMLIACIQIGGYAPQDVNPMIGPPTITLVRLGAKDTSLIVYQKEWWRLFSPIFLHAGILHLISNVFIQLRVGGYLNLIFGTPKWLTIYLLSGIFGNLMSCCFIPNAVGVGSSGALLGMLSAWIVWIVFRWKKIPPECRGQRNCQLGVVIASVAITLGMSFSSYVDWAAHFGGAIQGILLSTAFLSNELDNVLHRKILRLVTSTSSVTLFIAGLVYLAKDIHPQVFPDES